MNQPVIAGKGLTWNTLLVISYSPYTYTKCIHTNRNHTQKCLFVPKGILGRKEFPQERGLCPPLLRFFFSSLSLSPPHMYMYVHVKIPFIYITEYTCTKHCNSLHIATTTHSPYTLSTGTPHHITCMSHAYHMQLETHVKNGRKALYGERVKGRR